MIYLYYHHCTVYNFNFRQFIHFSLDKGRYYNSRGILGTWPFKVNAAMPAHPS